MNYNLSKCNKIVNQSTKILSQRSSRTEKHLTANHYSILVGNMFILTCVANYYKYFSSSENVLSFKSKRECVGAFALK